MLLLLLLGFHHSQFAMTYSSWIMVITAASQQHDGKNYIFIAA